ncbi:dihydrofolate reductase [Acidaminobacter sp. JC074]|uniref:NAD(P)-dependent oxidoreductase n=1 Tax=Acidaminobacter sp. JC074 TaxID=2530199 RepID=UPI001F0E0306|nr:NAD(P)-dependent oxidoreductase [Acidaminobacter sp. JC074]MCH4889543.1 dihydrofolate reductase [Acidaminobacter sp. JC074]
MINKIVSVDYTGMVDGVKEALSKLAKEVVYYDDYPRDEEEIISRIKDAEVILVSWNTKITKKMIDACSHLKYVGMCCSLIDESSANVDIKACRERNIPVLGVRDYGDEGVAEFIISELIRLTHGFGDHMWKEGVHEITKQKLGIIGMGATGIMVAERAKSFGMEVYYYSRSKKDVPYTYLPLNDLLEEVDILSTHLPRHTQVLNKGDFKKFGNGKIFINTSLGPTYDVEDFKEWLSHENNFSIMDYEAMGIYRDEFVKLDRLIYSNKVSGWTEQAKERLSWKVLENLKSVFN